MNDHEKYLDAEENVSCPYNPAHCMPRKRLAHHLVKCRKQYPELAKEFRECTFNITHRIPRVEYEYHLSICPDRETYYNAQYQIGTNPNNVITELEQNIFVPLDIPCTENWDEVVDPRQNILDNIKRQADDRCVLQNHSNEPPSVRKAKRAESRQKMREKLNEEDRKHMMTKVSSSTSDTSSLKSFQSTAQQIDNDDALSTASASTLRSTNTNISYHTALENTVNRMGEFKLVERKKKIGRGSECNLMQSRPLVGIGRGKLLQNASSRD